MTVKQYKILRKLITICLEGVKRNMTFQGVENANAALQEFDDEFGPKEKKAKTTEKKSS